MRVVFTLAVFLASLAPARGDTAFEVYRAMGLDAQHVIGGSVLSAKVVPGAEKQTIAMITHFTGKKSEADGVNVRLEIFRGAGKDRKSVYSRDFGAENGGYVTRGELQLVDLDGDGVQEILPSWDDVRDPLVDHRRGEVIVREPSGAFRTAWSGELRFDATRDARGTPQERRDRFTREIDLAGTMRTRGVTLIFRKTVTAVAGERLPEAQVVTETFPLRAAAEEP